MSKSLNVLLFADGHAGVAALRGLHALGHTVSGCITHAEARPWQPSVADECGRLGVPCSTDVCDGPVRPSMADRPDVVLSVAYRRHIGRPFLGLGKIGAFNVAGAPLPQYRGAAPFRWAILNGETAWGVTVHQMTAEFCDGAVLHRKSLLVKPTDNAYDLYLRTSDAAAFAAIEAVTKLADGDDHLVSVDSAGARFVDAAEPYGGRIDWHQPAARVGAFVRAMDFGRRVVDTYQHLTPPARATIGGRSVGIFRASCGGTRSSYPAGTVTRCDDEVWVQAGRGHVVVERVFVDGINWSAPEFFRHRGIATGDRFDVSHSWNESTFTRELSHAA